MKLAALFLGLAAVAAGATRLVGIGDMLALCVISGALWGVKALPAGATPTKEQRINNGVHAAIILVAALTLVIMNWGGKPSPTRQRLNDLQAKLEAADEVGDFAAAQAMYAPVTDALQSLSEVAPERRSCQLAGMHLADAVDQVARGSRWADKSRFNAALRDCK